MEVRARVQFQSERGIVFRFEAKDKGIGISKEQMAKLLQDFEQADTSTTWQYGGMGLGLSISQRLAHLMVGSVGVESEVGKGSTFWGELPFETSNELPVNLQHTRKIKGIKALILEDSEADSELLKSVLSMIGVKADSISSAEGALEALTNADRANDPYRLLYIDYRMPGLDGIDFALMLKSRRLANPPTIFLVTAFGDQLENQVIGSKAEIIRTCEAVLDQYCGVEGLAAENASLQAELEVVTGLMQRHISANALSTLDQTEYQRQYDEYAARFEATRSRIYEVSERREALITKRGRIQSYLETPSRQELITKFDDVLWYGTVDQARVAQCGNLRFIFKDGTEIEE